MKIDFVSDVWTDTCGVPELPADCDVGDVLILAGNVGCVATEYDRQLYEDFLARCVGRYGHGHVLLVTGRREHRRSTVAQLTRAVGRLPSVSCGAVVWLRPGNMRAQVDGQWFCGCTLWSHVPAAGAAEYEQRYKPHDGCLSVNRAHAAETVEFLRCVQTDDVVITHCRPHDGLCNLLPRPGPVAWIHAEPGDDQPQDIPMCACVGKHFGKVEIV